jgi:hypothetical protein
MIKNQDGESVLESGIERSEDGVLFHTDLSCYSASGLGLGTCQCHSHNAYRSRPLSIKECSALPLEWYHLFCGPGRDQVVIQSDCPCSSSPEFRGEELAKATPQMAWLLSQVDPDLRWAAANTSPISEAPWYFTQLLANLGVTLPDLEKFCELSYRIGNNPLPRLRKLFPECGVNFMLQDESRKSSWSHDDGDPPEIVVELCDMRDSDGTLRVWIETYF